MHATRARHPCTPPGTPAVHGAARTIGVPLLPRHAAAVVPVRACARTQDDPHGDTSSTVAGIERAKLVAYWFAIPGMLIFLAYIGVRGS